MDERKASTGKAHRITKSKAQEELKIPGSVQHILAAQYDDHDSKCVDVPLMLICYTKPIDKVVSRPSFDRYLIELLEIVKVNSKSLFGDVMITS